MTRQLPRDQMPISLAQRLRVALDQICRLQGQESGEKKPPDAGPPNA
jgi:hypothetical protein